MMFRAFLSTIVFVLVIDGVVGGVLREGMRTETTKGSKSMKSDSPSNSPSASATETPLSLTVNYRAIQSLASEPPLLTNALATVPGSDEPTPSLVGSKFIFSSPLFCATCTPVDDNGEITGYLEDLEGGEAVDGVFVPNKGDFFPGKLPPVSQARFNLTVSCELTEVTTTTDPEGNPIVDIKQTTCEFSMCKIIPFSGGCGFYRSGGSAVFKTGVVEPLSPITASQTSGTGLINFGLESFFTIHQISGNLLDGTAVLDFDFTLLQNNDVLFRNFELASTVPGFIPKEGEGSGPCGPCGCSDEGRRLNDAIEAATTMFAC